MTKADSDLKAAVSAILKREQSERSKSQTSLDPQFAALSRNLGKKLQPIYSAAGLDIKKIRELQSEHRNAFNQLLEKSKPKIDKSFASRLRERTSNKKRALELAGGKPLTITQIVLDKPTSIFAWPSGISVDDHIESWNSWAKVRVIQDDWGGYARLKFFFGWRNPSSEFAAVINAKGEIVAHGRFIVAAYPGIPFGGTACVGVYSNLKVWTAPFSWYVSWDREILSTGACVEAQSSFIGGDDVRKEGLINAINNLECNNIIVAADEQAIFEVEMTIELGMFPDSRVNVDFSSGDFQVTSGALIVELLTAPMVTADLGSVSPINVQS